MIRAQVRPDGSLQLGDQARRAGFRPGAVVEVIVTSSGSLILAIDSSPPPIEGAYTLMPGRAQLPDGRGR